MQINLIDIGSVDGLDAPWNGSDRVGHVLSFEPNEPPRHEERLISYPTAVWNYDGEAEFTVYGYAGRGSSLLRQNVEWARENFEVLKGQGNARLNNTWFKRAKPKGVFMCPVRRLDTILADLPNRPRYHFLKSDTQSGEWFVLDGARQYLADECLGVELECFRYPLYKGLETENRVIDLMNELGFEEWGWTGYQNSFLSQADRLFLRKDVAEQDRTIVESIKETYGVRDRGALIKQKKRPSIFKRISRKLRAAVT